MNSLISETKLKPGFINKIKGALYKDLSFWDFTVDDPKFLASFFTIIEQIENPSDYNISQNILKSINSISSEYFGDTTGEEMEFTEPKLLLKSFKELNLSKETVEKIIGTQSDQNNLDYKVVNRTFSGFLKYLEYQDKRGSLVKFYWS